MARTDGPPVVADAGPLIHLDELSALDVIGDYAEVWVPEAVWREVERHRPQALQHQGVRLVKRRVGRVPERVKAVAALHTLHMGERDALALCVAEAVGVILTDDTAARLAAKTLDLAAHGTLGLLIRSVRRGLRTPVEVIALLEAVPARTTLHIRPSLLNEIVAELRSEWRVSGR